MTHCSGYAHPRSQTTQLNSLRLVIAVLGLILAAATFLEAGDAAVAKSATPAKPSATAAPPELLTSEQVAQEIDRLIGNTLSEAKLAPAPLTTDEDFLRRVTFDLAGTTPQPGEVTLFGLDPTPQKRALAIDRLLKSPGYARNWAQYWREVIYSRATDPRSRISQQNFEAWMEERLARNDPWDHITTDLLTATGGVLDNGATALFFAHQADPEEIASESARIFLGIQIQCANCHDHPSDKWKREQFHQLAAFFPRVALRRDPNGGPVSFTVTSLDNTPGRGRFGEPGAIAREPEKFIAQVDRNGDKRITEDEIRNQQFKRIFNALRERADSNKDNALTADELKAMAIPEMPGRGSLEHYMPDLNDPNSRGLKIDPVFFVDGQPAPGGLPDSERRQLAAKWFTSKSNPWFARAFVNRIWFEMLGAGFYMPVDDLGPDRSPSAPQVVELLSSQFAAHDYDIQWLLRTIANSETYQRSIRAPSPNETHTTFAAPAPTRLRADQLYDALTTVLGIDDLGANRNRRAATAGPRRVDTSPRGQFNAIFGFDPSTPQDEITGTVPQSLFFMNSPQIHTLTKGTGQTRLARILNDFSDNDDALTELYLLVLSRQPSEKELEICRKYIATVSTRQEAFEDLLWSLLNSSEFLTKR